MLLAGARVFFSSFVVVFFLALLAGMPRAETVPKADTVVQPVAGAHEDKLRTVNGGTIGIITGGIGGTYIRIATDLAAVLDDGDELRILPIAGKGSIQNITDILYLRGVDVGIVQSDVLEYVKQNGTYPDIASRIAYITKLYNEEFHVVARQDVNSMADLAGRKVNFGNEGSGSYLTASVVFKALGIEVQPVTDDYQLALEKLKTGEIAAMVYVTGKPAKIFTDLKPEDGLKMLPVEFTPELEKVYQPTRFASEDYPALVAEGKPVDSIAVGAVMAVFNWKAKSERGYRLKRFVDAFFSSFDELRKEPRHPKWQEVNLAAEVPGWKRHYYATQALKIAPAGATLPGDQAAATDELAALRAAFKAYIAKVGGGNLSAPEEEALFNQFLASQVVRNQ